MELLIRLFFNKQKESEDDQPVIDAGEHAKQLLKDDTWKFMWTDDEDDPCILWTNSAGNLLLYYIFYFALALFEVSSGGGNTYSL